MLGTYYETDRLSSLIFVLVICGVLYIALYIDQKIAEKKGLDYQTSAYKNRGAYKPKHKNCNRKF